MRPQIVIIFAFLLSLLNSSSMLAQSDGSTPPTPLRPPDPLPEAPIDATILVLLVAGIIYGIYVAYKRRKLVN